MIRTALVGVIALGTSLAQCQPAAVAVRRPAQQIFIPMNYSAMFDARPGDTVNAIMEPGYPDPQGWCDTSGGSLWMNPFTQILICENIDF